MNVIIESNRKIGFTGTREGLTDEQHQVLLNLIIASDPTEVHHGDCVGADAYCHTIAVNQKIPVILHPPDLPGLRMFCTQSASEIREEKPYLDRNHDIVDETDILIACPKGGQETIRSGTWATVRYARKQGKQVIIIYPSGRKFVEWAK